MFFFWDMFASVWGEYTIELWPIHNETVTYSGSKYTAQKSKERLIITV